MLLWLVRVLTECSHFFRTLLQDNPNPCPLIYLQEVGVDELLLLKQFMYLGKAQVNHEKHEIFMILSRKLLKSTIKIEQLNMNMSEISTKCKIVSDKQQ